jgi:sacsin
MLRSYLVRRNHALADRTAMLAALKYCLSDIDKTETVKKLEGLPLIPLANGKFGTFSGSSSIEKVFVADEIGYKLLKDRLLDRIVDPTIEFDLLKDMHDIAEIGGTNIYLLSPILLRDLLLTILPSDWHGKQLVYWNASQNVHPTLEWLELLWKFLNLHSADLTLFLGWPLLPTSDDNHLLPLVKGSKVIVGDRWSENLINLLQKADCFILSSSFVIEHPQLGEYVHDASASGLLETLLAAAGSVKRVPKILKDVTEMEMHELRGFLLQRKWFQTGSLQDLHIDILKHLSIFKSFGNSSFVNLSDTVRILPPSNVDIELLGGDFIQAESEKEENILTEFLGVKKIKQQEYYEHYAFKNLHQVPPAVHERIVLNLIKNIPSMEKEVPSLKRILSEAPIIPSGDSKLKAPKAYAFFAFLHSIHTFT